MQSQNQKNSQFMITKEVFIEHIPEQIEQHYQINPNCLGSGGFGRVFEARKKIKLNQIDLWNNLGSSFSSYETSSRQGSDEVNQTQLRAIKCINFNKNGDKQLMKNQIQILSYLDHPSIIKLYETYQYKKQLYLVTDLLKGKDLYSYIENKKETNQQQVKIIFLQLIKAINYLHSQHICHRDLKLENLLFLDEHSLNLKLIDFGLAYCWDQNMKNQLKRNGANFKLIGTSDYMSPEMLAHSYDERCDIWAAGVILYMLLSGTSPFPGDNDKQIEKKIRNYDYTFQIPEFQNLSNLAKDLIEKMLCPQSERISLQQILNHSWLIPDTLAPYQKSQDISSNTSVSSSSKKYCEKNLEQFGKKIKTIRSFDKIKKKGSLNSYCNSQCQQSCKCGLQYSESCMQERNEQLTVQKMQYYSKFSYLRKFFTIYSVSKLSESKTKPQGRQFMLIDKNNDGSISLQDLTQYLFQMERFCDKQKTQYFFNQLALSKRGYISYTQYLACVLSYQSTFRNRFESTQLQQFDDKILGKINLLSQSRFALQSIEIFDQHTIFQLFYLLDKNKDGFICKKDFYVLLQNSGIQDLNQGFLKQVQYKISLFYKKIKHDDVEEQGKEQWEYDPRKFKQFLSRTYKGESDGGTYIDFKTFRDLLVEQRFLRDGAI